MTNQTSRVIKEIATLTIANGQQASNVVLAVSFAHFEELGIFAPVTLAETAQLQVSAEDKALADYGDSDFRFAESPPGTIVSISANGQTTIGRAAAFALRVRTTTTTAAERVFKLVGRAPLQY